MISSRLFGGRTIVHVLAPAPPGTGFEPGAGRARRRLFLNAVRGSARGLRGNVVFRHIAAFEFRYHVRSPLFWVTALIFALLTFGSIASDSVRIGGIAGNVKKNSPFAVGVTLQIMAIFAVFIMAAFVSNVVVRDDETGFGQIVHSTRVSTFDYLFGRFTGAFAAGCAAFVGVPLACCSARSCHGSIPRRWGHFDRATISTPTSRSRCPRSW